MQPVHLRALQWRSRSAVACQPALSAADSLGTLGKGAEPYIRGMYSLSLGARPELPCTLTYRFCAYSFTVCFQMEQLALSPSLQRASERSPYLCQAYVVLYSSGCTVAVVWDSTKAGTIIFSLSPKSAYIYRRWITNRLLSSPTGILCLELLISLATMAWILLKFLPSFLLSLNLLAATSRSQLSGEPVAESFARSVLQLCL